MAAYQTSDIIHVSPTTIQTHFRLDLSFQIFYLFNCYFQKWKR